MQTPLRKLGNSSCVIIPKAFLNEIGAHQGDTVELQVEGDRLVISPVRTHPRAGWAEASRALAAADDDALAWPEFANADDADWTW
jgi:antitoxin MazE